MRSILEIGISSGLLLLTSGGTAFGAVDAFVTTPLMHVLVLLANVGDTTQTTQVLTTPAAPPSAPLLREQKTLG
jgi:hypothetical protein